MKIGEVAENLSIAASRIRYYESEGLLGEIPRVSARRDFDAETIVALDFIMLAQSAGFSVGEIKILLASYNQNSDPKTMWRRLAQSKREQIKADIIQLQKMDRILEALLRCECSSLTQCVQQSHEHG